MADAVAHGKTVLSGIVTGGGSLERLSRAQDTLTPEHFTDPVQRVLFQLLARYALAHGGIMSRAALDDLLRNKPPGTGLMFGEAYDALSVKIPEPHEFSHSLSQLRELALERATGEAMATARLILREPVRLDDGRELFGHEDARRYVMAAFAEAEAAAGATDSPGGDVTAEGDDVLADYARVKELRAQGKAQGIEFGLPALDAHLDGGLGHGELALIAAAMTGGKSSLCAQTAWYNAVEQGRNVLVFTTEQHRTALRIKLVARHSRHPKFGLPRGLDTRLIRSGRLDEEGERALAAVVADLKTGGYGGLQVVQMPESCTLSVMAARAESIARTMPPDLVIIDYLQLFDPERRSRDARMREDQSGLLKGARGWARSFRRGQGVPVISPWQVNKEGINGMRGGGDFRLEDLSETIEAGRTPTLVLGLGASEEDSSGGRTASMWVKVLKNRDGPRNRKFPVTADFATCYFTDAEETAEAEEFLNLDDL